jgi:hypothetical protein
MKKLTILLVFTILSFFKSQASTAEVFYYNETLVETELHSITQAENLITSNYLISDAEIQSICKAYNLVAPFEKGTFDFTDKAFSFCAGGLLGPIGILGTMAVYYFATEDDTIIKKAAFTSAGGCLATYGVTFVIFLIIGNIGF